MRNHPWKKVKFASLLDEEFAVKQITGKNRKESFIFYALLLFEKEINQALNEYGKGKELSELTPLRIYRLLMSKDVFIPAFALWAKTSPRRDVIIDESNGDYYYVTDNPFIEGEILVDDSRNNFMKKK